MRAAKIAPLALAAVSNAQIHAFEPAPANLAVLEKNAVAAARITVHPYALGDVDGELQWFESDDPANPGGSLHDTEVNAARALVIPVRQTAAALAEAGLSAVDVIKADSEGSEWEILTAIPLETLKTVKLIMGELHGRRDFALLDDLQPHFDIGL